MIRKKLGFLFAAIMFVCGSVFAFTGCTTDDFELADDEFRITVAVNDSVIGEYNLMMSFARDFYKYAQTTTPEQTGGIDLKKIKVQVKTFQDYSTEVRNKLTAESDAWDDVMWTAGDLHSSFSEAGHFVDVEPFFENDPDISLSDYYDAVIQAARLSPKAGAGDGIYFVPRDYNRPTLILNKDMFEAAGVALPDKNNWGVAEFERVAKEMRAAMDADKNTRMGIKKSNRPVDLTLHWSPAKQSVVRGLGGKFFDTSKEGADAIVLDSAESVAAYKKIGEWTNKGYIWSPGSTAGMFTNWSAAMAITVRPDILNIGEAVQNFDFMPLPFDGAGAGCSGYQITKANAEKNLKSKDGNVLKKTDGTEAKVQEVAWQFLKYIISERGQNLFGSFGSGVPCLKSLETTGTWTEYISTELNHSAFISDWENDFSLNDSDMFDFNKRGNVKTHTEEIVGKLGSSKLWEGSPLSANINGNVWATGSASDSGDWSKLMEEVQRAKAKAVSALN